MSLSKHRHWRDGARLGAVIGLILLASVCEVVAAGERFALTLNGKAVKDNKTGLVWEQAPDMVFDVGAKEGVIA